MYAENTITAWRKTRPDERESAQLATRLKYIHVQRPAPKLSGPSLRPCPSCWSPWILFGHLCWFEEQQRPLDVFMCKVAVSLRGSPKNISHQRHPQSNERQACSSSQSLKQDLDVLLTWLSSLIQWRDAGHLTDAEFSAAQQQLGLL